MAKNIDENNVLGDEQLDSVTGGTADGAADGSGLPILVFRCLTCGREKSYPWTIPNPCPDPRSILTCPSCGGYMVCDRVL